MLFSWLAVETGLPPVLDFPSVKIQTTFAFLEFGFCWNSVFALARASAVAVEGPGNSYIEKLLLLSIADFPIFANGEPIQII